MCWMPKDSHYLAGNSLTHPNYRKLQTSLFIQSPHSDKIHQCLEIGHWLGTFPETFQKVNIKMKNQNYKNDIKDKTNSGSGEFSQFMTLLQSWHSGGVPLHRPPNLAGKQEPFVLPPLKNFFFLFFETEKKESTK